jgi:hypothetical protein
MLTTIAVEEEQLFTGLKNIGVELRRDEQKLIYSQLDPFNFKRVDLEAFQKRFTLDNLHRDSHGFLISETRFVDCVMQQWYSHVADQTRNLRTIIRKFDSNNDGVFQLSEFRDLMAALEPGINNEVAFFLFKESLS